MVNEPSMVALNKNDKNGNKVIAVGNEAKVMLGRTPGAIQVIRPMRDGVIADYLTTEAMLRYFIGKVNGRLSLVKPEVMICVPAGTMSTICIAPNPSATSSVADFAGLTLDIGSLVPGSVA